MTPIIALPPVGENLYSCLCVCGNAGTIQDVVVYVCADDLTEAGNACHSACVAQSCDLAQTPPGPDVIDYEGCSTGSEEQAYKAAGGIPNSSEASLDYPNVSHATLTYFGHGPTTIEVGGDVKFTGGCESGTCPISFNLMYFTPDDFTITDTNNTQIQVTDVYILNDGEMAGSQTDTLFTIPSTQVRLLVNGYMNTVKQSLVFSPAQDVSGYYVPSTGEFSLSAHFFSGTDLDLELDLEGAATSRPPVAHAGSPQQATANAVTGTARVTLNGSGSSDLDGDLVEIAWFEGSTYLGSGTTLGVYFGVGAHTVTAVAIDATDKWNSADTTVTVVP